MTQKFLGAIEAGGTKFNCLLADSNGEEISRIRIDTTSPEDTLSAVNQFFSSQVSSHGELLAIGIAAFGPVDVHRESPQFGHILKTPKPGWSHTDLASPLTHAFSCPVLIDTDVNAAALAEARFGAGAGCDTVVYVTVGTGIGGGIYSCGRTLTGALHPEMGHIGIQRLAVDREFTGNCPFHGDCLEGLASGSAILARFGASLDEMDDPGPAVAIVGNYLGQMATTIILLLSPERIVFGGGVMNQSGLLPVIRQTVSERLNHYLPDVDIDSLGNLITAPGLGNDAGLKGALEMARQFVVQQ